jgi:hypothetical protein
VFADCLGKMGISPVKMGFNRVQWLENYELLQPKKKVYDSHLWEGMGQILALD